MLEVVAYDVSDEPSHQPEKSEQNNPSDSNPINDFCKIPEQAFSDSGKLTVVLDIDETLVHTVNLTEGGRPPPANTLSSFIIDVGQSQLLVCKRPFLDEFLRVASDRFELIAFTAGSEDYAQPLLNTIDPEGKYFRHRLFRQHCSSKCGKNYVKDLSVLNRPLHRMVLVDNNPLSFLMQLNNGIPIAPFMNDRNDRALITLFDFLLDLHDEVDVRGRLKSIFGLETMFQGYAMTSLPGSRSFQPRSCQIVES